ncbi:MULTISPECIES: allantoinase AllB [unclassified Streptomyces]|uniref:allantoinase AllB n=1 Tax=unclassified Streptomyces TaxID=2593676 RepID=UPI00224FEE84|nr:MULTISPECIES: allantoinase AllB [unclassified Streptomyces]WSP58493.1 allantoinase AllB [Streptomyces sp. NBC_01241]WSU20932.1 allantoinase AllB [Streptomyces sp. NBC_01108]MCX4790257.1 allantoinase AllB [Streptomyces sp. NBC_01221]MCX4794014.1 allantoinase AllB [Streptomyces sp. NBC_01242]WSJ35424.1 allantoinase AllB [Streptomyces sp. NBC_01321]
MSGADVKLVLRSTRVVTPDGTRPAVVAVAEGRIDAVLPYDTEVPAGARLEDFGDDALLPGLVDTHVHVNDPGRTAWEGFHTATRAAAAGGITTLLDMPLNSLPPTTTVPHLRTKQQVAAPKAHIDTGFWGGAIPSNVKDLRPLHEAGVFGFKCFLSPSGVDEFPELDQEQLARSMAEISGFGGLLIVHAEDPRQLASAPQRSGPAYADFLASRPRDAENTAIEGLIAHARRMNARVHVLHLSSSDALPLIAAAKREGVRVTVESCPHFLTLTAEEVPDGATEFKCCPPIREAANQDALWEGLADGTIDCIVSDHSPCTADLKTPDFASAWGGISSLQLGLPAIWTEARKRGHSLDDVVRWMSAAPAELAGLPRKGAIEAGRDADFAVLAPDATFTVDPAELFHRNQVTAYAGKTLHGVVRSTWLRGRRIAADGTVGEPTGRLLERNQ